MNQVFNAPWKIRNELECWLSYPIVRVNFAMNRISWRRNWRFHGVPVIMKYRNSQISFGDGLGLRSSLRSNPLAPNHRVIICTWKTNAVLHVGWNFAMTGGTLCVANSVKIGNNVTLGANTIITDTDFHPLNAKERAGDVVEASSAPIVIEDDVFIGMNCIILKGVHLSKGCVIGAGSVVTKDVQEGWIAAGNPAREIRRIENPI